MFLVASGMYPCSYWRCSCSRNWRESSARTGEQAPSTVTQANMTSKHTMIRDCLRCSFFIVHASCF